MCALNRRPADATHCAFAVENKRGYGGDETIRQLVRAIDTAAHKLPAVQRRMPQAWLRVHDELRRIGNTRRKISLDEVCEVCLAPCQSPSAPTAANLGCTLHPITFILTRSPRHATSASSTACRTWD